jgi:type I restriction enzyme S subunit
MIENSVSNWKLVTLGSIAASKKGSIISGPFGSNISSKYFVDSGIPVIRGNNLSLEIGIKFKDDNFVFLTEEKANELRTWAQKDDLIFTAAGTIGQVGILQGNEKYNRYIISNKQLRVTLDKDIVDPLFAYYWFASPIISDTILKSDTGSTIPLINLTVLKGLPINLPPLPEQHAIASVLSSLDDKIDLLHRQNKTLESMAETLFRQWFFEEADEGWEEGSLSDLVVVKYGKDHKKLVDGVIPVFGSGGIMRYADTSLYTRESVLIPRKGTLNNVIYIDEPFWTVDTMFYTEMKKPNIAKFIYHFVKDIDFAGMNVGSAVPSMTTEVLNSIPISVPTDSMLQQFENSVKDLFKKRKENQKQIKLLESLRDTLLPKLMSGEVRVQL